MLRWLSLRGGPLVISDLTEATAADVFCALGQQNIRKILNLSKILLRGIIVLDTMVIFVKITFNRYPGKKNCHLPKLKSLLISICFYISPVNHWYKTALFWHLGSIWSIYIINTGECSSKSAPGANSNNGTLQHDEERNQLPCLDGKVIYK